MQNNKNNTKYLEMDDQETSFNYYCHCYSPWHWKKIQVLLFVGKSQGGGESREDVGIEVRTPRILLYLNSESI